MRVELSPATRVRGEVDLPGDKGISQRALLLAALAEGESTIVGRAVGEDQDAMVRCLRALGVAIEDGPAEDPVTAGGGRPGAGQAGQGERARGRDLRPVAAAIPVTRVRGVGLRGFRTPDGPLDCGNSGATMRFLIGALAAMPGVEATLVGDASLTRRPMERVAAPLRHMGARIETSPGGTAPVRVRGTLLEGAFLELEVASAQVKTAVLLAALNAHGPTTLREPAFTRDHTERFLRRLGVDVEFHQEARIQPPRSLPAFTAEIPGDPSSAAFWAVLAAIHPDAELTLRGVCVNPSRTGFSRVLSRMGARLDVRGVRDMGGEPVADLVVRGGAPLRAVEVVPDEVPGLVDEVPVLAVAAAFGAGGESRFRGLAELRVKEVDRLDAIAEELEKLGAPVGVVDHDLVVGGGAALHGATFDSRGDHRIAMAMAVAASAAAGGSAIEGAEAANVSYPRFWEELARVTATETV
ncbi:MAG TPA: 3-phosphoshikimate 1-carboxyvinyltransferase [Candidatus Dormibacteraeota bacterium]|nr:3-phosphoshikimate 1-carboxyvinyltransferase [Candidatus Dormibacteraeota bacterium]